MANALVWAIKNGEIEEVKKIIEQQRELVNEIADGGRYPLHFAADYGQVDVVRYLIEKGANIDQPDKFGITPLLAAVFEGHESAVKILVDKGAKKDGDYQGQKFVNYAEKDGIKALLKS